MARDKYIGKDVMWKKCISGNIDFCNENDNPIIQIFRLGNDESNYTAQVFYNNGKSSKLVFDKSIEVLITKCIVLANELGWDIDFHKVDINPDFQKIQVYESDIFKALYK